MSARPVAAFIESNTSGSGGDFIRRASELGLAPTLLTDMPARYRFLGDLTDIDVRICDTSSESAVAACLDAIAERSAIACVASTSDFYVAVAAIEAYRLGLGGPDPGAIALCRDKARQWEVLAAAGVGVPPRSVTISALPEAGRAIQQVGLPVIIKPISGTGSIGVSLAQTESDATAALDALLAVTTNARGQPINPRALVMLYVPGDEFSIEILDGAVIGVTKKHLGGLPYFVETGHDYPAYIPLDLRRRIEQEAARAVDAVGHMRGPAHVELRATHDKVVIIEVNPRLAGGSIPSLIRHATGVDVVGAVLESAWRGRAEIMPTKSAFGSLRFIIPRADGPFHPSYRPADVSERFGLAELVVYRPFPVDFQRRNDFRDRIGHVIAVDADPLAAARRADAAVALLCQK